MDQDITLVNAILDEIFSKYDGGYKLVLAESGEILASKNYEDADEAYYIKSLISVLGKDYLLYFQELDALTKIPKRKGIINCIESKKGEPFLMALIDCDKFKLINDTYGHAVGDEVLKAIASIIRNNLRICEKGDIVGRFGGDEFVALINTDNISVIQERFDRINDQLQRGVFIESGNFYLSVSISFGIIPFDYYAYIGDGDNLEKISKPNKSPSEQEDVLKLVDNLFEKNIELVDKLLYAQKDVKKKSLTTSMNSFK